MQMQMRCRIERREVRGGGARTHARVMRNLFSAALLLHCYFKRGSGAESDRRVQRCDLQVACWHLNLISLRPKLYSLIAAVCTEDLGTGQRYLILGLWDLQVARHPPPSSFDARGAAGHCGVKSYHFFSGAEPATTSETDHIKRPLRFDIRPLRQLKSRAHRGLALATQMGTYSNHSPSPST
jgi:hypothetical protein